MESTVLQLLHANPALFKRKFHKVPEYPSRLRFHLLGFASVHAPRWTPKRKMPFCFAKEWLGSNRVGSVHFGSDGKAHHHAMCCLRTTCEGFEDAFSDSIARRFCSVRVFMWVLFLSLCSQYLPAVVLLVPLSCGSLKRASMDYISDGQE